MSLIDSLKKQIPAPGLTEKLAAKCKCDDKEEKSDKKEDKAEGKELSGKEKFMAMIKAKAAKKGDKKEDKKEEKMEKSALLVPALSGAAGYMLGKKKGKKDANKPTPPVMPKTAAGKGQAVMAMLKRIGIPAAAATGGAAAGAGVAHVKGEKKRKTQLKELANLFRQANMQENKMIASRAFQAGRGAK